MFIDFLYEASNLRCDGKSMRRGRVQKRSNIIERIRKTTLRIAGNTEHYVTSYKMFLEKNPVRRVYVIYPDNPLI